MLRVALDLRSLDSAEFGERGIARWCRDVVSTLCELYPDMGWRMVGSRAGVESAVGPALAATLVPVERWSEVDVLHVLSPFDLAWPVRELWPAGAWEARVPLVLTVFDLIPEIFASEYLVDPGVRCRYRARREFVRAAEMVVTLSASTASDAVRWWGVSNERIRVVGAAASRDFDTVSTEGSGAALLSRFGVSRSYVLCVGGDEPRKNLARLTEAWSYLSQTRRCQTQLIVVCRMSADSRERLLGLARHLGVEGQISYVGGVASAVLRELYAGAELVVVPSLYEGFGLPVVEAWASGTPVVAGDNSGLRELVPNEARFDAEDPQAIASAIENALSEPAVREALGRWLKASPPSWLSVGERLVEVYRSVARRRIGLSCKWPDGY